MRSLLPLALLSSAALAQAPAASRPTVDQVLDGVARMTVYREVAISPEGNRVAWVERIREKDGPAPDRSALYVVDRLATGKAPTRVTACPGRDCDEQGIAWSPDGRRLAFLSDAEKRHQRQLYVADLDTVRVSKLTDLRGTLGSVSWSPDGETLALLFIEGEEDTDGPLGPAPRETGVAQERIPASRITVVSASGGAPRQVSPPDLFVYEYDWSPDGSAFAATAARGEGEANWWVAELFVIQRANGEARSILQPSMQICNPRWAPDGKAVAFIGGLMSDRGLNGGDIFLLPLSGGAPKNLTPGLKASASGITWLSPEQLLFGAYVDGGSAVATVGRKGGPITFLWTGPEDISDGSVAGISVARDGVSSATIRQTFTRPPEIHAGPIGSWTQLTHGNDGISPAWGEAKSLQWTSDGLRIQGWLLAPRGSIPTNGTRWWSGSTAAPPAWRGRRSGPCTARSRARATTSSCPTRAAASAREWRSPAAT